jgi:hypothetical protein
LELEWLEDFAEELLLLEELPLLTVILREELLLELPLLLR